MVQPKTILTNFFPRSTLVSQEKKNSCCGCNISIQETEWQRMKPKIIGKRIFSLTDIIGNNNHRILFICIVPVVASLRLQSNDSFFFSGDEVEIGMGKKMMQIFSETVNWFLINCYSFSKKKSLFLPGRLWVCYSVFPRVNRVK